MRRKQLEYIKTDYRVSVCADILGGSTRQLRLPDGSYYADRSLTPLTLMPRVTLTDPNEQTTIEDAAHMLTAGAWYRLDSTTASAGMSQSTLVTAGTLYEIDSTPGSQTYGKLTIKENIDPAFPATFVFQGSLPNGRIVTLSVQVDSEAVPSGIPKITFDNNPRGLYNPVEDERYYTIHPLLAPDNGISPAWSWESCHDGTWVTLGSTRLDWAVEALTDGGVRIDRKHMQQSVRLRVHADFTLNGVAIRLTREVSHTRRLPELQYDPVGIGDMLEGTTTISPRMAIAVAGRPIEATDSAALAEIDIGWYGQGDARVAGSVMNPSIAVSALGPSGSLGYEVRDKGGYFAITDSSGAFLVDSDGAQIIAQVPDA